MDKFPKGERKAWPEPDGLGRTAVPTPDGVGRRTGKVAYGGADWIIMRVWVARRPAAWDPEGGGGAAGREGRRLTSPPSLRVPSEVRRLPSSALNDSDRPHPRTIGPFVSARPMAPLLGPPISHWELQLFSAFGATSDVTTTNWLSTTTRRPLLCHCLGTNGHPPARPHRPSPGCRGGGGGALVL